MHHHHDHLVDYGCGHPDDPCMPGDYGAPCCDDQLPVISRVGRGPKGDTYRVRVATDENSCAETYLEGMRYDEQSKTWHSEWVSENINGGCLSHQYNLRPFTIPMTFTITFIYRRPNSPSHGERCINLNEAEYPKGECSWSWTTPAIPYLWTVDEDGGKLKGEGIVGSGIATLFTKTGKEAKYPWIEKLIYPDGTVRTDYNAPDQGRAWTSNLEFGIDGEIPLPNREDLANILGFTEGEITDAANKVGNPIAGYPNLYEFIMSLWRHLQYPDPDNPDVNIDIVTLLKRPPISHKVTEEETLGSSQADGFFYGTASRYEYHPITWLVCVKVHNYCDYAGGSSLNLYKLPVTLCPIMQVIQPVGPEAFIQIDQDGLVSLHTYDGHPFKYVNSQGVVIRNKVFTAGTATFYAGSKVESDSVAGTPEELKKYLSRKMADLTSRFNLNYFKWSKVCPKSLMSDMSMKYQSAASQTNYVMETGWNDEKYRIALRYIGECQALMDECDRHL